jgi:hypothetical protein
MDLSKLSDKDLEALANNDLASMSDAGLQLIAGEQLPEKKPSKSPYAGMTKREIVDAVMTPPAAQGMEVGKASDLLRQLGLFARAGITGAASLPTLMAEPIAAMTGQPSQAGQLQRLLTQLGLPEPQTGQERIVQDITSAGAGVAAPASIASRLPAAIRGFLTENLGTQAAAATGGALASGAARESDASPIMQVIGSLGGAMAGGGATGVAPAVARGAKEVVRPFTQAGREVVTGNVLRSLATDAEQAIEAGAKYAPSVPGYTPTTAQATRDIGLISAETPIRALDTTGKFGKQIGEANQARLAILDKLAKDESALNAAKTKREEVTSPIREKAFASVTVSPETFQSGVNLTVNKTIDDILASPAGKRGTVISVMDDARADIARATTPQELYEIRKDLRAAAQGLLDKSGSKGPNAGAYKAAKNELEQVIRSVDDAIESAAPGYKNYLDKYSKSSRGIERMEAAQEFRGKVLSTTPDPSSVGDFLISQPSFTRAIRAAEKETNLSAAQVAALKKVAADLDSGVLARGVKVPGSDTFKNMSTANIIGGIVGKQMYGEMPPAFSKMMAPMNWLYNGTDDAIRELIVDAMLDPKLASRLMAKASVVSIEPLSKELQRKAKALGYGATFGLTE